MDAAAEVIIELSEMDTRMEVHVQLQDGEEHVTRNSMGASQCENSVEFHCNVETAAEEGMEVPEMDAGKEGHDQDDEEHVNGDSVVASEMNGDMGNEKQGEESKEGMSPTAAGSSYLHPLVLSESESDAEYQTWIHRPFSTPEGSWLHALYVHLVNAGFDDIELRQLFRSRFFPWSQAFQAPTAALAEQEKDSFEETHQQSMGDVQMPSAGEGSEDDDSNNGEQLQQQQIPQQMGGMTVQDMVSRGRGVSLLSKAFHPPAAALAEPEKEFEEMQQQSMSDMHVMPLNSREGNQGDDSHGQQLQQMPRMTVRDMITRGYDFLSFKAFDFPDAALAEPEKEFEQMQMPPRVENQGDGSNGEQLQEQQPKKAPKKPRRVRTKKTAAIADLSKLQGLNCTQRLHFGFRKNTPAKKKNKGYLKNRLQ